MTALLLSSAGSALGGFIGGPIGAMLGRAVGAIAGAGIDQRLFGGGTRVSEGPRLHELDVQSASEGEAIPKVYGRARIAGQIIWATRFEEDTTIETSGGKATSLIGGSGGSSTSTTRYSYFANLAIGLSEGPIGHIGRIWADGKVLNREELNIRIYKGDETQEPDPLIQAKQGTLDVPAYRGLAYVVFERLPIGPYGNRIPQLTFEIIRPIGLLEEQLKGVCLIPGATEFGYHTLPVTRRGELGASVTENAHSGLARTDFIASLDELQALAPNLESVSLIVPWFGTDLRLDECRVKPGVDNAQKQTTGATWSASGVTRGNAHVVSQHEGRAAYGGTPADVSIIAAIKELRQRGLKVTLTPFLLMDIPHGNHLPDPWTGEAGQPAYPWRGRITCDPAPGLEDSLDGTSAVTAQVEEFFGAVEPQHFNITGETISYSGPDEFSYRRQVLHLAALAKAAGGVDLFVIGSELKGLTRLRSATQAYPAIEQLISLAADVRGMLGANVKITYAADWTEYGSYISPDGNDVLFPLDGLWACNNIDAIGIDFYAPLTDWRDEENHLDGTLTATPYEYSYLTSRIYGGEAFDFYYADEAARAAQTRLPINDGSYNKPWVYRPKDLKAWWQNAHIERINGIETQQATGWVPQSKPIYFMEIGVPAVDLGANQPNVFPDLKSSEGGLPYGSQGRRDDAIQRRALEALLSFFDPESDEASMRNPSSEIYDGRMVDMQNTHVWAWDARPWPAFPSANDVWGDGANWGTGHWLNGRLGAAPIDRLAKKICEEFSGPPIDVSAVGGIATGYVVDRPMSGRAALEPLAAAFSFDFYENGSGLACKPYALLKPALSLAAEELAEDTKEDQLRITRAQETELPRAVQFTVTDADMDFRRSTVSARLGMAQSDRELRQDFALVMPPGEAQAGAETLLHQAWMGRETVSFSLPLSELSYETGDLIRVLDGTRDLLCRITRIEQDKFRRLEAKYVEPQPRSRGVMQWRSYASAKPQSFGAPFVVIMDLPALPGDSQPYRPYMAATASPWPGRLVLAQKKFGSFQSVAEISKRSVIGSTLTEIVPGPVWRVDRTHSYDVTISAGTLSNLDEQALLAGGNSAALCHDNGSYEILQFANAELIGARTYRLSTLLRGQLGTEHLISEPVSAGAVFILLDGTPLPLPISLDDVGRETEWRVLPEGASSPDAATDIVMTPSAVGLLPLAPKQVRMSRSDEGVTFSFQRRTRVNGDSWEIAEVPLGETVEAYEIDILDGAEVKRTFTTSVPQFFYPESDELADFGAAQTTHHLRIAQMSATLGRGRVSDVVVTA